MENGRGTLELIKYTQYIVVVYQKGRKPYVISVDTENPPRNSNLSFSFIPGRMTNEDFRPQKHYEGKGGRFSVMDFDLDKVRDKGGFALQMQKANREIKAFYDKGTLPKIEKKQKQYENKESMRKTEHTIGQEIYKLLTRKRALELELEKLNKNGFSNSNNSNSQISTCEDKLNILRREKQYYKVSLSLAEREVEKNEIMTNRQKLSGQAESQRELQNSREKFSLAQQQFEVAELNYKNAHADCWALKLQSEIDNSTNEKENKIRRIEISEIRTKQRKDNALKLNRLHNKIATKLTGRERVVELANAQKFASDHAKAQLSLAVTNLNKIRIKDNGKGRYKAEIGKARKEVVKKEEMAYQAEMSYLEHMWHLRENQDLEGGMVDDLFVRQTGLLDLENLSRRDKTEDFVSGFDPMSSALQQAQALYDNAVKQSEREDQRGKITLVKIFKDEYEIIQKSNGRKEYIKNGKPITSLTYRFETIRVYGEYLDNVKVEEEKKKQFLNFFKKKTEK